MYRTPISGPRAAAPAAAAPVSSNSPKRYDCGKEGRRHGAGIVVVSLLAHEEIAHREGVWCTAFFRANCLLHCNQPLLLVWLPSLTQREIN
jgi:hypothetical protein